MLVEHLMPVAVQTRRFTADEVGRMEDADIFRPDERVELLDGQIYTRMPLSPRHEACVDRTVRELFAVVGDRVIVRTQGSVRLDLYNQPLPDLVLLRPREDFYASRYAGSADILLIIEIALSSIRRDRKIKGPIYARMGIVEYWLADLNKNVVTCYTEPRDGAYQVVREHHRGELLAPQLLPECPIAVDVMLIQ